MAASGDFIGLEWQWIVPLNTMLIAVTGFATWLWTRGGKAALLQQQVINAETAMKAADARTDVIQVKYDSLLNELHTHQLSDAAAFAKLEAIATEASRTSVASEVRLTQALDNLGRRIDSMSGRFDQFMNRLSGEQQQHSPQHSQG